jgi:hypothetical protein
VTSSRGLPRFLLPATSGSSSTARQAPQLQTRARLVAPRNLRSGPTLPWRFSAERAFIVGMDVPTKREPVATLIARLAEIQSLSTGQLRTEFQNLAGRPTGSWNREWLRRKVSWLVQERERQRSDTVGLPTLVPEVRNRPRSPRLDAPIQLIPGPVRDPRLPKPGSVLVRDYRGLRLTVTALERGFEWNGRLYRSLSAVAKAVTGAHWNGRLFFGLTRRQRGTR